MITTYYDDQQHGTQITTTELKPRNFDKHLKVKTPTINHVPVVKLSFYQTRKNFVYEVVKYWNRISRISLELFLLEINTILPKLKSLM